MLGHRLVNCKAIAGPALSSLYPTFTQYHTITTTILLTTLDHLSFYDTRCPLDGIDDTLDAWSKMSGAQKCPACSKLIEKNDKESCNHMVHKITDGIPCVKDRTDFCYCCGMEVLDGYPHDEVLHPGVNHFPDGVYQKCRHQQQEERDAERERLKKLRRMKSGGGAANAPSGTTKRQLSFGMTMQGVQENVDHDEEGWEMIPQHLLEDGSGSGSPGSPKSPKTFGDRFDQQWDSEMEKVRTIYMPALTVLPSNHLYTYTLIHTLTHINTHTQL